MSRGLSGVGGAQTTFLGSEGAGEQVWLVWLAWPDGKEAGVPIRVGACSREDAFRRARRARPGIRVVRAEPATLGLF